MNPQASVWLPRSNNHIFTLQGTALFDHVRAQFCSGITTLDNLLRFMENFGAVGCKKDYRKGIDCLLDNLMSLSKWLVNFLVTASPSYEASPWAINAMVGVRIELYDYSWKVLKIARILEGSRRARKCRQFLSTDKELPPTPPPQEYPVVRASIVPQKELDARKDWREKVRGCTATRILHDELNAGLVC